jgi:hypothetical protein
MRHHHYHSSNAFLALVALDYLRRNGQQPQPQRAGLLTWLIVLALLAPALPFLLKGLLVVAVIAYLALDSLPWHEIGNWVGIPLAVFGAGAALCVPAKTLWLAWWRGGWAADVVAAFVIVAAIGVIWPQTGIWDSWVHRAAPLRAIATAPPIPDAAPTAPQAHYLGSPGSSARYAIVLGRYRQREDYDALPSGAWYMGNDRMAQQKP